MIKRTLISVFALAMVAGIASPAFAQDHRDDHHDNHHKRHQVCSYHNHRKTCRWV